MSLSLLRKIADDIVSSKLTIMVDETTDVNTVEQVVTVLHWVSNDLDVHEDL